MSVYYNDSDPAKAQWLRNLIAAGLLPKGDVDERSILEVEARDLSGYTACHFFAGIGGWPLAIGMAGWPADEPVWTGSCPCQPFSSAGRGKAQADPRHLWPAWFRLIRECRPSRVFGEQVAAAVGWGWFDGVSTDLEATGYAVGAAVLGAHSVAAPHKRQRLYWVADAQYARHDRAEEAPEAIQGGHRTHNGVSERDRGRSGGLAHAAGEQALAANTRRLHAEPGGSGLNGDGLAHGAQERRGQGRPDGRGSLSEGAQAEQRVRPTNNGGAGRLDDPTGARHESEGGWQPEEPEGRERLPSLGRDSGIGLGDAASERRGEAGPDSSRSQERIAGAGFWDDYTIVHFTDGKARRVEPGTFPLAARLPGDLGRLRGYGDSVTVPVATEFVSAYLRAGRQGAASEAGA